MKALILLSGGLDSTVALAMALEEKRECHAISFDYGQRHRQELKAADAIAKNYRVPHRRIVLDPETFAASSLVSTEEPPKNRSLAEMNNDDIPNTYVPARNTLFLAYATSQAELLEAAEIYIGANAEDRFGYPDCRPEYLNAFQAVINLATKQAVKGRAPRLVTPLVHWDKAAIIQKGESLKAPLHMSFSCYDPTRDGLHCGICDACVLRRNGFSKASIADPTHYFTLPSPPMQE